MIERYFFTIIVTISVLVGYTQKDLMLKDNGILEIDSKKTRVISFGGDTTPECKLAISLDGKYFYLKKIRSTCRKFINRYGKKIICNYNKSICKTRDELRDFALSGNNETNIIITNQPSWCKYAKTYVENKICSNERLWELDEKLVKIFNLALMEVDNASELKNSEKIWVQERDLECNSKSIECIINKYNQRIAFLKNLIEKNTHNVLQNNKKVTTKTVTNSDKNIKKSKHKISTGTGFYINKNMILTNYHVVKNCSNVLIKDSELNKYGANVKVYDKNNDLAVLKSKKENNSYLFFRTSNAKLGEQVITLGYPMGSFLGENVKLTIGNISSLNGILNDITKLQFTAPVQHGNSGGPLIDNYGTVTGVIYAGLKNDIAQNVNLAIKNNIAQMLLNSYNIKYYTSDSNKKLEIDDIVTKSKDSIVQVICKEY